jgi:hypothetical protein
MLNYTVYPNVLSPFIQSAYCILFATSDPGGLKTDQHKQMATIYIKNIICGYKYCAEVGPTPVLFVVY